MGLQNGGIDLTGLINTEGLEKKLDPVINKLDEIMNSLDELNKGKKISLEIDKNNIKDIDALNSSLEKLNTIKKPDQKIKYFQSAENAIDSLKKSWNSYVTAIKNGDIDKNKMLSDPKATAVLRYANAFEALKGDIQSISPEIAEFVNKMRDMDKFTEAKGYTFTVSGFSEAFKEFSKLQETGVSFKGFEPLKKQTVELLSLIKETNLAMQNLEAQTNNSFGNGSSSNAMDNVIAEQQEYQAELQATEGKIKEAILTIKEMEKQLKSSHEKQYVDVWDVGLTDYDLTDIKKLSEKLEELNDKQETALERATVYQNELAEAHNNNIVPSCDYERWMNREISDYQEYTDQIEYVQNQLQKALYNYVPDAEGNNAESINALVLLLQNLNKEIIKIRESFDSLRVTFADVGDGEEFSPLLKMINNIQSAIENLNTSIKGIGLNMNINVGSDPEAEAKVQSKIANALRAYQRLFDHIKTSSAGGSIINTKFFEFDINQYDTMMGKLKGYKKFINDMREEAKTQANGKDVLFQGTDKSYWTSAWSAAGQVTKVFNEMKASSDTSPLENLFGGQTDLTEIVAQLNLIVDKLGEISVTASELKNNFANGFNVSTSVEEIEKLTSRVKELEDELSKVKVSLVNPVELNIASNKLSQDFDNDIQKDLVYLENYKNTIKEIDNLKLKPETDETRGKLEELTRLADYFVSQISILKSEAGSTISSAGIYDSYGLPNPGLEKYPKDMLKEIYNLGKEKYGLSISSIDPDYKLIGNEISNIESKSEELRKAFSKTLTDSTEYAKGLRKALKTIAQATEELKTETSPKWIELFNKDIQKALSKFPELEALKDKFITEESAQKFIKSDEWNKFLSTLPKAQEYLKSIGYEFNKIQDAPSTPIKDTIPEDTKISVESSDSDIKDEAKAMEQVAESVVNVENAVKDKNKAFIEEADIVSSSTSKEIEDLGALFESLQNIKQQLQDINNNPINIDINKNITEDIIESNNNKDSKINNDSTITDDSDSHNVESIANDAKEAKEKVEEATVEIKQGTVEWDHIAQAAEKYKHILGESYNIVRQIRDANTEKPKISYRITGETGNSITLGHNTNLINVNNKVSDELDQKKRNAKFEEEQLKKVQRLQAQATKEKNELIKESYNEEKRWLKEIYALKEKNAQAVEKNSPTQTKDIAYNNSLIASYEELIADEREYRNERNLNNNKRQDDLNQLELQLQSDFLNKRQAYNDSLEDTIALAREAAEQTEKERNAKFEDSANKNLEDQAKKLNEILELKASIAKEKDETKKQTKNVDLKSKQKEYALLLQEGEQYSNIISKEESRKKLVEATAASLEKLRIAENQQDKKSKIEEAYEVLRKTEEKYQKLLGKQDADILTNEDIIRLRQITEERDKALSILQQTTNLTEKEINAQKRYREEVEKQSNLRENTFEIYNDANLQKVNSLIDDTNTKLEKLRNASSSEVYINAIQEAEEKIKNLNNELNNDISLKSIKNYEEQVKEVIKVLEKMKNAVEQIEPNANVNQVQNAMSEYAKSISDFKAQRINYNDEKGTAVYTWIDQNDMLHKLSMSYDEATGAIYANNNASKQGEKVQKSLSQRIKEHWKNLISYLATFVSFYEIWAIIKQGISVVTNLDTALTEMRKVSDETVTSLKNFQKVSFDIAHSVGTTASQIQESTADFMRLGETLNEAAESAKTANILLNVSEFESIDDATESLVAMSSAYSELDKMQIVDKLNEVGNNYAISTDGIAIALQDSASALKTASNDMDEAIALVTAGNAVTQDPSSVGAGLRTIALRLTGTSESKQTLTDLGEDTEGVITTVAKLRDTIMSATAVASNGFKGFDILDENGNYKSTYEILKGIADVYQEIVETDKKTGNNNVNLLLETIAGKNRANIAASILQNKDILENAFASSTKAEGSAQQELDKYLDSIEGKLQQFQNAVQKFWYDFISSDTIKTVVDFGTKLINLLDDIIGKMGIVKTAIAGIATIITAKQIKNGGGIFTTSKKEDKAFELNDDSFIGSFVHSHSKKYIEEAKEQYIQLQEAMEDTSKTAIEVANDIGITNQSVLKMAESGEVASTSQEEFGEILENTDIQAGAAAVGVDILNASINMIATWVISELVQLIIDCANASDRLRESAKTLGSEFSSTKADIDDYKIKIDELYETINDSSSSYEDTYNARKELLTIQDEMIDKFGEEAEAVNLITQAINGSTEALNTLSQEQWAEVVNKFNNDSDRSWTEKIADAWNNTWSGNSNNFNRMIDDIEDTEVRFQIPIASIPDESYKDFVEKLKENFSDIMRAEDFFFLDGANINSNYFTISGDLDDIYQKLLNIQFMAKDMGVDDTFLSDLSEQIEKTKNKLEDYEEIYDQHILYDKILSNDDYEKIFTNINEAYKKYNEAFLSGDEEEKTKAKQNFAEIIQSATEGITDQSVIDYFNNMYPDLQDIVGKWNFEVEFNAAITNDKDNFDNELKNAINSFNTDDDINNYKSIVKTIDYNTATDEQKKMIDNYYYLEEVADKYSLSIDQLTEKLVEMGLVQKAGYQQLVELLGQDNVDALTEEEISLLNSYSGTSDTFNQYLKEEKKRLGVMAEADKAIYESYQQIIQEVQDKGIDLNKTVYGNIDTNNRQVLEWTKDTIEEYKHALASWELNPDDLLGSFSTVLGMSASFDGIEIAFSPMLQTENGAVLLNEDTINQYIYELLNKASADGSFTNEELLCLDAEGLEIDGQKIKGIIADIGDTAIQTGEAMHYTGELGAVVNATKECDEAANKAGYTTEQWMQTYNSTEPVAEIDAVTNAIKKTIEEAKKAQEITPHSDDSFIFTEENTTAIDDYRSKISTLGTALDDLEAGNDIDMSELYEAFPTLMETSDDLDVALKKLIDGELETLYETLGNPPESLKRALEKLADQAKNISISIDDVTNAFSNLKNAASTLEDIKTEIEESGKLSAGSLDDIIQAYPEMIGYVGQYATGVISVSELYQQLQKAYEVDKENYKETLKAKLETDTNFYEAVFENNQEYIKVMNNLYGTDYENWKTVAQAKKEINNTLIKQLSGDWNRYYEAIYDAETNRYSLQTNSAGLKDNIDSQNFSRYIKRNPDATGADIFNEYQSQKEEDKKKAQEYVNNANKALAELEKGVNLNDLDLSSTTLASLDDNDSKKDKKDEFSQTFNWVENKLDALSKKTEKLKEKFEEAFTTKTAKTAFKDVTDQITDEIEANEKAAEYYEKKANGVKLSPEYKRLVDSGALKIEDITDEALAKQVELYQDYKDKAEACRDTIDDLRDNYAELADTFYSKPLEVRDNNIEEVTTQLELLDSKIENATSAKERENYAKQKESLYKKEYKSYQTAEKTSAKYLKSAKSNINQKSDKALKGLTDKQKATITNAVKKGVEITDAIIDMDSLTPEALKAIENYNSALRNNKQAASDAAQAEQDLAQNIRENKQVKIDSKQDEIDNLKAQYENLDENNWQGRNDNLDEQIKKTKTLYKLLIDQETDVVRKEQLRAELNKEIADLKEQQVENIRTYWQNVGNLEGSIADERNSKQDYLEASGKDTVASRVENYNTTAFQSRKEAVAKLEEAKTFKPNTADYHSAMSEYWSLMAQASEAEYNVWKESVLGVYDSVIDEVTKKGDDLEKAIELDEAKGIEKDEYDYIALINQASAEIAVNQNKIEQLQQKQQQIIAEGGSIESTAYKDLQAQIEKCEDAIYDNQKAQIEYNNALDNLPLERLEKALELLEAIGDRYESENDLKLKLGFKLTEEDFQNELDNINEQVANLEGQINEKWTDYLKAVAEGNMSKAEGLLKEYDGLVTQKNKILLEKEDVKDEKRDYLYIKPLEDRLAKLEHKSDMLSGIGDLIPDDMKFDSDGNLTDLGRTAIAIDVSQLGNAREQLKAIGEEISVVQELYEKGEYTLDERNEKMNDLQNQALDIAKLQMDSMNSLKDMATSMAENELDALNKIIEKRKEALQSKKSYYDYDKNLRNQNKQISALEAEIAAMKNVDDAYTKSLLARKQAELDELKEARDDTIIEHNYEIQSNGLDELQEDLQTKYDEYIDGIGKNFESIEGIVSNAKDMFAKSFNAISISFYNFLEDLGLDPTTIGINLSDYSNTQGFATGGIIRSNYTGQDDRILVRVNPDETILTKKFTDMLPSAVEAMENMNIFQPAMPSLTLPTFNNNTRTSTTNIDTLIRVDGNVDKTVVGDLKELANDLAKKTNLLDKSFKYTTAAMTKDAKSAGHKRTYH